MSSFTDSVEVSPVGGGKFKLLKDFEYYYVTGKNNTESIIMQKGRVTDFASVPAILHWILKPTDKHLMKPSLVHDELYSKLKIINHRTGELFTRKEADIEMFIMMYLIKAPLWKLLGVYIALRLFGWWGYNYKEKGQKPPLVRVVKDAIRGFFV